MKKPTPAGTGVGFGDKAKDRTNVAHAATDCKGGVEAPPDTVQSHPLTSEADLTSVLNASSAIVDAAAAIFFLLIALLALLQLLFTCVLWVEGVR